MDACFDWDFEFDLSTRYFAQISLRERIGMDLMYQHFGEEPADSFPTASEWHFSEFFVK